MSSCSSCFKKYGLFLRETGCAKCGFSFCKNCCKYELTGIKKKVCLGCYNKAQKQDEKPMVVAPVVDVGVPRPITPQEPTQEANPDDVQLQQRLAELKRKDNAGESSPQPLTDLDLKQRLANLQDRPYVEEKPNRDIFRIDQRSEQEKVNDLVEQYHNEVSLDVASDPVKDLEQRLRKLRGIEEGPSGLQNTGATPVVDEDEDYDKKYVKKIIEEAMLDAKLTFTDEEKELMEGIPKPPDNPEDLEELPWCTICNEDAKIRCNDCDGELYCNSCFKEIHHDDEEYRAHKRIPYQKPKKMGDLSSSDED